MDVLTEKEREKISSQIDIGERIEKEVSLSWDGKNLIMRFPKELADYFEVNEENRFTKNVKFFVEEKDGQIIKNFDVVERTTPKRITKDKK